MAEKTEITKPADLLWQEEQLKNKGESTKVLSTFGDDPNEGLQRPDDVDGYLGTDLIYQNAANSTERPLRSEKGAESKFETIAYGEKFTEQPQAVEEEPEDAETSSKGSGTTPPTGLQTGVQTPVSGS